MTLGSHARLSSAHKEEKFLDLLMVFLPICRGNYLENPDEANTTVPSWQKRSSLDPRSSSDSSYKSSRIVKRKKKEALIKVKLLSIKTIKHGQRKGVENIPYCKAYNEIFLFPRGHGDIGTSRAVLCNIFYQPLPNFC